LHGVKFILSAVKMALQVVKIVLQSVKMVLRLVKFLLSPGLGTLLQNRLENPQGGCSNVALDEVVFGQIGKTSGWRTRPCSA
jgi:hypothetical protein